MKQPHTQYVPKTDLRAILKVSPFIWHDIRYQSFTLGEELIMQLLGFADVESCTLQRVIGSPSTTRGPAT